MEDETIPGLLQIGLRDLERKRVKAGVCRHCGERVPCWSFFGDRAVGKRHTAKSFERVRRPAPSPREGEK